VRLCGIVAAVTFVAAALIIKAPLAEAAGDPEVGHALAQAFFETGQLAGRLLGTAHDLADVVVRHGEDVVQDEGDPFAGRQRVEDDQERGAAGGGFLRGVGRRAAPRGSQPTVPREPTGVEP